MFIHATTLNRKEATSFYRELATKTDGFHLHLDQFSSIVNFMMAICFKEEGGDALDNYETEVVGGEKKMNRELHRMFATLQVYFSTKENLTQFPTRAARSKLVLEKRDPMASCPSILPGFKCFVFVFVYLCLYLIHPGFKCCMWNQSAASRTLC